MNNRLDHRLFIRNRLNLNQCPDNGIKFLNQVHISLFLVPVRGAGYDVDLLVAIAIDVGEFGFDEDLGEGVDVG